MSFGRKKIMSLVFFELEFYLFSTRVFERMSKKKPALATTHFYVESLFQIRIFFNDGNERPVTFYHILKLFHGANTPANAPAIPVDVTKGEVLFLQFVLFTT